MLVAWCGLTFRDVKDLLNDHCHRLKPKSPPRILVELTCITQELCRISTTLPQRDESSEMRLIGCRELFYLNTLKIGNNFAYKMEIQNIKYKRYELKDNHRYSTSQRISIEKKKV